MIKRLKAWLEMRRQLADQREYARGWAWARSEILNGNMDEEEVAKRCDPPFCDDPFDKGARAFLYHYEMAFKETYHG